jgi:Ca2+-binding RTX toxin-like protein
MAIVQTFVPTNMSAVDHIFNGIITFANNSEIIVKYGGINDVYLGNFSYSLDGSQVFGTLTDYKEFSGNTLIAQISNGSVDANLASNLIRTGQQNVLFKLVLSGNDIIVGSSGDDILLGYNGNDIIVPGGGINTVDGGAGFDTVVIHASGFASTGGYMTNGFFQINSPESVTQIINVERVQFNDSVLALDIQGNAGNAYRLYQAAFNRAPDKAGLSFWTHAIDTGTDIFAVAQGFVNSSESKSVYGTNPTHAHIVDLFYQNVLGRVGETAGINFWVGQLDAGLPVSQLLQGFAVSSENHSKVDPVIAQGILLDTSAFLV